MVALAEDRAQGGRGGLGVVDVCWDLPMAWGPWDSSGRYPQLLGHSPPSWALVGFVLFCFVLLHNYDMLM